VIEGYNDTIEHQAQIYTINRAQVESDPLPVPFRPLPSPLGKAVESVKIQTDFGGVNFSWQNVDQSPLIFEMLSQDVNGELNTAKIIGSDSEKGEYILNGFPPEPTKFGLVIYDNFGNQSDLILPPEGTLIPLLERRLPKEDMQVLILPQGDKSFSFYGCTDRMMIDDNETTFGHTNTGLEGQRISITLDLGGIAKLSRIVIHQRPGQEYASNSPRNFDIYTREAEPSADGNWEEWNLALKASMIKPSGSDFGIKTDADMIYALAGIEFFIPANVEPARYLRFDFLSSWYTNVPGAIFVAEITVYGDWN
jgi:hypothetical protein